MGGWWAWFGNQGFEYLDLGRFWQVLLSIGLFFWVAILFRGLRGRLRREHAANMPWLFFFAALAIPAFYAVGLLARPESHFTTADFWRFWVVHLWVEDFLELFTTVMVAYIFVLLGVVREKVALTVIFLDILLYSAGGVIGTMHHLYFSGTPAEHMALGAFFSAAEVIPLTFLTVEAWSFLQLGARQESRSRTPFPHRWAVMFLVAVGFWNFLGAGIFGFLINLPIISYYQIGTALTANHGHAAMMGVYGMLAAGLALFCLRYLIPEERWSERAAKWSFWSLNIGLAWMCFATLFPLGILQLYESVSTGYFEARSLEYITNATNALLEWMRLPGDVVFIVGGVLPLLYLCYLGVRHTVPRVTMEEPEDILFTEISRARDGRAEGADEWHPPRGVPRGGLRHLPARRRLAASTSGPPLARPLRALPDRRVRLPPHARRLDLPRGPAPYAERGGPRAAPDPLPGQAPDLQPLPRQVRLHRLRRGQGGGARHGPLAPLGGGPLPPRHLARRGPRRRPDPRGRDLPQPRSPRAGRTRGRAGGRRLAAWHLHAAFRASPANFPASPGYAVISYPQRRPKCGLQEGQRGSSLNSGIWSMLVSKLGETVQARFPSHR